VKNQDTTILKMPSFLRLISSDILQLFSRFNQDKHSTLSFSLSNSVTLETTPRTISLSKTYVFRERGIDSMIPLGVLEAEIARHGD